MANAEPLIQEIITKVSGEQELRSLISGLEAHAAAIRKTDAAAKGAVDAHKKMGDEARKQQQAFSQAGMQINQFAGQIVAGTPVMTAMVQQMGDIVYVVGQAGGAMGKFGSFLAGPWGAAILVAISVLGPLIAKIWASKDAADAAKTSFDTYMSSLAQSSKLSDVFTENATKIALASGELGQLTARFGKLKTAQALAAGAMKDNPLGAEGSALAAGALGVEIGAIQKQIAAKQKQIQGYQDEIRVVASAGKAVAMQEANKARMQGSSSSPRGSNRAAGGGVDRASKSVIALVDIVDGGTIAAIKFAQSMEEMGAKAGESIEKSALSSLPDTLTSALDGAKPAIEALFAPMNKIAELGDQMGQTFSDGIKGMITGAMSFKDAMSNVISSVINELWQMFVVQQIVGMVKKGLSAITGIPLPGKAIGGPVQAGQPYMVGERGPEMFIPSRSGSIAANNKLGGGMVVHVDARGSADPAAVRLQVQQGINAAAPIIIAAAQGRTLKAASRTQLPGTIG